jgi:SAM domain (Sterile alpha motif)
MDVASWLRSLGLEQYEAVFRKNEIDESVLADLTEDHLHELGFPLGARLKILEAIAALGKHVEATAFQPRAVEVSPALGSRGLDGLGRSLPVTKFKP